MQNKSSLKFIRYINKYIKLYKLKVIFRISAEHPLSAFLILVSIFIVLGGIIFYQYGVLPEKKKIEVSKSTILFNQEVYQKILGEWNSRQEKFEEALNKQYLNPFQEIKEETEEVKKTEEMSPETESTSTTSTTSTASTTSPEAEFPTSETKSSTFDISGLNTLYLFYIYTQGSFPSIEERALIWQEKKLGLAEEYWGFSFQNEKLLELLKAELTQ